MSLLNAITGGKTNESSKSLEKALAAIMAVKTPTAEEMKYKLQKLVAAGKLTPEQAQTFLQDPNALASMDIDQTGTGAQQTAISGLLNAAQQGGLNPQAESEMADIVRLLGTQERGANESVLQNQAARGALTSGQTLAAQLYNNQNAAANANQNAQDTAGRAYQQMLAELTSAGSLGGNLQGQQNAQGNTVAAATNEINKFNAAQQQGQENLNVGANNEAQRMNLANEQDIGNQNVGNENQYSAYEAQLPQQVFNDEMSKASALSGVYGAQAKNYADQGKQNAGVIGAIGSIAAPFAKDALGAFGQDPNKQQNSTGSAAQYAPLIAAASGGGEIHDYLKGGIVSPGSPSEKAQIPGDSPKNDKIPAMLSENEVVLPRSIAQNAEPDRVMSFLNRIRQKKEQTQFHPEDTAHVLKALALARGQ